MKRLSAHKLVLALPLVAVLTAAAGCSEDSTVSNPPFIPPTGGAGGAGGDGGTGATTTTTSSSSTTSGTGATGGGGEGATGGEGGATGGGTTGGSGGSGGATGGGGGSGGATGGSGGSGGATGGSGGSGGATGGSGGSGGAPECVVPGDCDDLKTCTTNDCVQGVCIYNPIDTNCDNGDFCDGDEICDPDDPNANATTGCVAGTNPCADRFDCTVDDCDEVNDLCSNVETDAICSNGQHCDGPELCEPTDANADPITGCIAGTPIVCQADQFTCTSATCNEQIDACVQVPLDSACNNGDFCDGLEFCDPDDPNANGTTGCAPGTPPCGDEGIYCTVDGCDETNNVCTHTVDDSRCDDSLYCTGVEWCDPDDPSANGTTGCVQGAAESCDDGKSCTQNLCDETNHCTNPAIPGSCDDGQYCNGVETCNPGDSGSNPTTGCVPGTAIQCPSDGVDCTVDECSNTALDCVNTPDNSQCPGQFCIPGLLGTGCADGAYCEDDLDCIDGDLCNGTEWCDLSVNFCKTGTPTDCDDDAVCTADSCNPTTGLCEYQYYNNFCNDGLNCNGVEICDPTDGSADPVTGCTNPPDVVCDDGWDCTWDSCIEPGATCSSTPQNGLCDNGTFCDGDELCNPSSTSPPPDQYGCVAGAPPSCSDDVACTIDYCDEITQQCRSIADDEACWDPTYVCTPGGLPQPTCDPVQGCGNFCVQANCGSQPLLCGNCLDDDGDCYADAGGDDMCFGPCDDTEDSLYPDMHQPLNCSADCYYDSDSGSGNDTCVYNYECDPHSVAPNYDPTGNKTCDYDDRNVTACEGYYATQTDQCLGINQPPGTWSCIDVTPNGCDCFGCCEIPLQGDPSTTVTVYLGSNGAKGYDTFDTDCELDDTILQDPTRCRPCDRVPSCLNECDYCEICLGKPELPPDCNCQVCPEGVQMCGPPCGTPCPPGYFCNTGCCALVPS